MSTFQHVSPSPQIAYAHTEHEVSVRDILVRGGIRSIIISALVFLSVYAWADAFLEVYRDAVADPPELGAHVLAEVHPRITHRIPTDSHLTSKQKAGYALILTLTTLAIIQILAQ